MAEYPIAGLILGIGGLRGEAGIILQDDEEFGLRGIRLIVPGEGQRAAYVLEPVIGFQWNSWPGDPAAAIRAIGPALDDEPGHHPVKDRIVEGAVCHIAEEI